MRALRRVMLANRLLRRYCALLHVFRPWSVVHAMPIGRVRSACSTLARSRRRAQKPSCK